jgi:hypothetical protein
LDFGDLPDERFEFLVIFGPLLDFGFEKPRDVERYGFACFLPGQETDRMFGPLVMASAVVLSALAGSGDEGPFDPGAEVLDLPKEPKALGLEAGAGFHVRIVYIQYGLVKQKNLRHEDFLPQVRKTKLRESTILISKLFCLLFPLPTLH